MNANDIEQAQFTVNDRYQVTGMLKYLLLIGLGLVSNSLSGQDLSNLRNYTLPAKDRIILSDSLGIISTTIKVDKVHFDDSFEIDSIIVNQNKLHINLSNILADSVLITFRVFTQSIYRKLTHFDSSLIRYSYNEDYIGFDIGRNRESGNVELGDLDYDGSFLRGLSFGNNQSLFLNSAFNLQIAGKINDDTEILAALTDENIPLQPQGNTQQLNEFDKIFIQVKNKNRTLTAGDYELTNGHGHFLKYFKRLKGGSFEWKSPLNKKYELFTQVSAAVSRGKFARYSLATQEGNQGPYKLEGAEGERFIIILSGTERIYIDGKLLSRGIDQDYIIDYNLAEIRFTSKQLITKDRRVIVEFDYTFEIYNRGFYALSSTIRSAKGQLGFQFYNEQDSKNPTAQFAFTEEQLSVVRESGDDPLASTSSSIRPFQVQNSFNPVTYKQIDTIVNGQLSSILIYSTDNKFTLLTASFSSVGNGNGNYIPDDPALNGIVFKWVAPNTDGTLNGTYEPITNLITPTKKQVLSLNGIYNLNKNTLLKGEISLSNNDFNKISNIDDDDNQDIGFYGELDKTISIAENNGWISNIKAKYEYSGAQYDAVKTFRNQEFNRDWNIGSLNTIATSDHLTKVELGISNDNHFNAIYELKSYIKQGIYEGLNQHISLIKKYKHFSLSAKGDWLKSTAGQESTSFIRPGIEITKSFGDKGIQIDYTNSLERNIINENNLMTQRSFQFYQQKTTLKKIHKEQFNWSLSHAYRIDHLPNANQLTKASQAHEIQISGEMQNAHHRLLFNGHFRNLSIESNFNDTLSSQNTYLSKIEHHLKFFNKGITLTNAYELGSGQEARIDVVFIETLEEGQGQYIHRDLNADGIRQNYEFFIASFSNEGNFNRILLGSTDFIRTNNVRFNQSLIIDFKKILKNTKNSLKFLKKISINSNLLSSKKNEATDKDLVFNPFTQNLNDEVIIAAESRWKSTLFINRANPTYQVQYAYLIRQNKNLFTTGFESRKNRSHIITGRLNVGQSVTTELTLDFESRNSNNEIFPQRNFNITSQRINPQITYLASRSFRWRADIAYENNENNPGEEQASIYELSTNIKIRKSTKSSIEFDLMYNRVDLNGELNPSIELDFLRGLNEGDNFQWAASVSKTLAKNLRLNFSYDGRKIGNGRIVHTGRAQIGATF